MVKINPKKIPGKWREGYALDYHTVRSEFVGYDEFGHPMFDTERSEIGELLYRLKYRSEKSALDSIVEVAADFITSWNQEFDLILPTPPSRSGRKYQPVLETAKRLSARSNITICHDCVVKVKDTPELKNVYDYNQRVKLLEAYNINTTKVCGQSGLVFDDLYRSGATLNAITDALYTKGELVDVYVLALTRTNGGESFTFRSACFRRRRAVNRLPVLISSHAKLTRRAPLAGGRIHARFSLPHEAPEYKD